MEGLCGLACGWPLQDDNSRSRSGTKSDVPEGGVMHLPLLAGINAELVAAGIVPGCTVRWSG